MKNGSIQGIESIPLDIQKRYKTGWEIKQRILIDMAAARGAFICQSQSLNLFVADANYAKLTSMHFHAWKQGLKTGCYYLRTKTPVMAQKFTVDPRLLAAASKSSSYPNLQEKDDDSDSDSYTTTDDEEEGDEEEKKKRERREKLDRLVGEYEAEKEKAKQEAADGDGCLMCGS
jgi:ribonucleotide reductase alpha subunit